MSPNNWREEAWEIFLAKFWDSRKKGEDIVEYRKSDIEPILEKYTKSGQGEIRIFHYNSESVSAVKKRGVTKIPITRTSWAIVKRPPTIDFSEPKGGKFNEASPLTDGMAAGVRDTLKLQSNPGETTLLAIANHTGIISDFYGLENKGTLFTGGRQKAGVHLVVGSKDIDVSKAQIEIDGGFEWPEHVVIVEMKSSFKQTDFDINQALLPMLKWRKLLKDKKVHSLVLFAETNKKGIEYWAYDLVDDSTKSVIGMKISKSKRYIIEVK